MRTYYKYFIWYSIFPLLGGLLFYLCFGSTDTKVYTFFGNLLGHNLLIHIRPDFALPSFLRFHLADGIWAFALTSTLFLLLHKEINAWLILFYAVLTFSFYELCQHFNWIGGTADLIDVCLMIAFSSLAFYQLNKKLLPCESNSYSF